MLLATVGILPDHSPVYDFLTTYVLSACLVLLLLNINLPAILKLGPTALTAMAVGAAGIAVGRRRRLRALCALASPGNLERRRRPFRQLDRRQREHAGGQGRSACAGQLFSPRWSSWTR